MQVTQMPRGCQNGMLEEQARDTFVDALERERQWYCFYDG
jgi:hypothetical protein